MGQVHHLSSPESRILTRSEQRLAQLERVRRPLTDEESDELRRCLHAVYCRNRRMDRAAKAEREMSGDTLEKHRAEELELLARLEGEML